MKSPPPSTHESWMKFFKLSPLLKGLAEEMMPKGKGGGLWNSYLFLLKGRIKGVSHQLQAPFDDQPWNEMKSNRLYESICVGFWRFPKGFLSFQWSSPQTNNQPRRLFIHLDFIRLKFFGGCSNNFINRRMGLCKWLAWMWSAHKHTPSIHCASPQWHGASSPPKKPKK